MAVSASVAEVAGAKRGDLTIIDIRKNPDDRQIPGSLRCEREQLESAHHLPFEKGQTVVIYCGSGSSSSRVAQTLREKGYENVRALEGGYAAWQEASLPTEPIDAPPAK